MSAFSNICAVLILVPVSCVAVSTMMPKTSDKIERRERAAEAAFMEAAKAAEALRVRRARIDRALADDSPSSDVIEIVAEKAAPEPEFSAKVRPESVLPETEIERRQSLKDAAANVLSGRATGEIVRLDEIAGVSVGDSVTSVVEEFGMPDINEPTNNRTFFAAGWPDCWQGSYAVENVSFVYRNNHVEEILVGVSDRDRFPLVLVGQTKDNAIVTARSASDGAGTVLTVDDCQELEASYGLKLRVFELEFNNVDGRENYSWMCGAKAVMSSGRILTPVRILENMDLGFPSRIRDLFYITTVAAGEKKIRAVAFPDPEATSAVTQIDVKEGFLYAAICR